QLAFSDGDHSRVLLMASAIGATPSPISPKDERSHFPVYLPDGRIVYVSEFVTPDISYTDLWSVDPRAGDLRTEVAKGVLAQGPFELSADGSQLLFASPRSGNFEIYAVTLDDEGKAALATRPDPVKPFDATEPPTRRVASVDPLRDPTVYVVGFAAIALMLRGLALVSRARRTRPQSELGSSPRPKSSSRRDCGRCLRSCSASHSARFGEFAAGSSTGGWGPGSGAPRLASTSPAMSASSSRTIWSSLACSSLNARICCSTRRRRSR